jgi:hypothetical protein
MLSGFISLFNILPALLQKRKQRAETRTPAAPATTDATRTPQRSST